MNEDKLRQERNRGHQAKLIIENPLWEESFDHYRAVLLSHMENTESTDEIVLEARRGLISLRRIKRHMENVFQTGKMAEIQLERTQNG